MPLAASTGCREVDNRDCRSRSAWHLDSVFSGTYGVDVLVIDREGIAAGATGRNAGFVVSGAAESYPVATNAMVTIRPCSLSIYHENRDLLRHVLAEEGIECDYREQGYLGLATTAEEWEHFEETQRMLHADGIPSRPAGS